jgi:hypothetical protein
VDLDADEHTEVEAAPKVYMRDLAGVKTFVVTAAQNSTPVNMGFLGCLRTLAAAKKAELIVCP